MVNVKVPLIEFKNIAIDKYGDFYTPKYLIWVDDNLGEWMTDARMKELLREGRTLYKAL